MGKKLNTSSQKTSYFWMKPGFYDRLNRTHACSQLGTRVTKLKLFYRATKVTAIGEISINKVLALMTIN
jgi:hypothetical protein